MRKERQTTIHAVQTARSAGYHEGGGYGEGYAFAGFRGGNKYFTSDRFVKLNENYERVDGKPLKGFGLEIELECSTIMNDNVLAEILDKVALATFPEGLFKYQHDGSLGGRSSTEAITQIMTKEFIRNRYPDFKRAWEYFKALGVSATDSGNCGMHVNISNGCFGKTEDTQADGIRKLFYIVNRHYDLMCVMFNRNRRNTTYCRQMSYTNARTMDLHNMSASHGNSFNGSHFDVGRIEIRLVGGQKDFPCFRNTMESVFHIVDRVKEMSWADCDSVAEIFKGANAHVVDRCKKACEEGVMSASDYESIKANGTHEIVYSGR